MSSNREQLSNLLLTVSAPSPRAYSYRWCRPCQTLQMDGYFSIFVMYNLLGVSCPRVYILPHGCTKCIAHEVCGIMDSIVLFLRISKLLPYYVDVLVGCSAGTFVYALASVLSFYCFIS